MMDGKRIIQSLSLCEFLSFGDPAQVIELQPLNVLIGANASGKSNIIEAFRILNAAPKDVNIPIRNGGGASEYRWKGDRLSVPDIQVEVAWEPERRLLYLLRFMDWQEATHITEEYIEVTAFEPIYQLFTNGQSELYSKEVAEGNLVHYKRENFYPNKSLSILSQIKDPTRYPVFAYLEEIFSAIQFYTSWDTGQEGSLRSAIRTTVPKAPLLKDGSNLVPFLFNKWSGLGQAITKQLRTVLPTIEEIFFQLEGATVAMYIREKGFTSPISTTRLSEGTLRYLCLLALLLDPTPPPIICLEEPEVGLHPHVIPQIAELLIAASQRAQLIVTTHSDALISGLSECPEAIIVCERDDDGTKLRRLEPEQIKPWLDRYAIGDLWRMGEIGGVR